MEQSGARLVDVGTTNRTRLDDYERAIARADTDVALVLKVHPSNYRVEGFVEDTPAAELARLDVPVVADIGSGLVDANVPWIKGAPPAWLAGEPGRGPDPRGGGRPDHLLGRQAARWSAGRHHRRLA